MMSGGVLCRLAALVSQQQCDQLDERAGMDLRRNLRIVCGSPDIRRVLVDEASEALVSNVGLL